MNIMHAEVLPLHLSKTQRGSAPRNEDPSSKRYAPYRLPKAQSSSTAAAVPFGKAT